MLLVADQTKERFGLAFFAEVPEEEVEHDSQDECDAEGDEETPDDALTALVAGAVGFEIGGHCP